MAQEYGFVVFLVDFNMLVAHDLVHTALFTQYTRTSLNMLK